uniref:Uncharacterized protein n=1 Tax=Siphoviridae sp. ctGdK3 TaxID=2826222 RepID=A0A8S5MUL3_9CAUD|nr:MAG TPA: hypothetical protein [Siphoviridae sp. ctGdK3]
MVSFFVLKQHFRNITNSVIILRITTDPGQTAGASVIIGVFGYSLCLHAVSHCYLLQDR